MDEAELIYFPEHDTVVAKHGSVFSTGIIVPSNFICGFNCHFWGALEVQGELLLGPHCSIGGDVSAEGGIIGYRSVVNGDASMEGDVRIMDAVEIGGEVYSNGRIMMRPGVTMNGIRGSGTVETIGD